MIASAASASAAAVTSQLWIAGTWLAAAVTPVLVALLSETLNRPTEKIAKAWTAERPPAGAQPDARRTRRPQPSAWPVQRRRPPVRIYRQPSRARRSAGPDRDRRGGRHAAIAFGITVVAITAGELISGDSIGNGEPAHDLLPREANKAGQRDERTTTTEERSRQPTPVTETDSTTPTDETGRTRPSEPTTTTPAPSQPAPSTGTPSGDDACALAGARATITS